MKEPPSTPDRRCHQCGAVELKIAEAYSRMCRVTSDCKPWPAGGVLAWCQACGLVQTVVNSRWEAEARQIYQDYTIYHQSGGIEQPIFAAESGAGRSRSEAIIEALAKHLALAGVGRLLDVGCGNGAFLRACSKALPQWSFCGSEVSDKYKQVAERIRGVEGLFTGRLEDIPGSFDLISLIHVLEHIPAPSEFLRRLSAKLKPGGRLLLEVPDCSQNSFTLLIADHCSHFSIGSLARVASRAGFEVSHAVNSWVAKEITLVACWRSQIGPAASSLATPAESEEVFRGCELLQRIITQVEPLKGADTFGIFGSSIAATWLDTQLEGMAKFFVDEDPSRVGRRHLDKPILSIAELPEKAIVYIALPPALASRVAVRLRGAKQGIRVLTP